MGVDLQGRCARSDAGKYFSSNWGAWYDMAELCIKIAPEVCARLKPPETVLYPCNADGTVDRSNPHPLADRTVTAIDPDRPYALWYSNDYWGLNDADARALADVLEASLSSDAVKYQDALSGQRSARDAGKLAGLRLRDGRPLADVMPEMIPSGEPWFIDRLRGLIAFLRDCGGFEIM
jgi:hypothetical protein